MRILNCLRNNPALINDLREIMASTITNMAANGEFIDFMSVLSVLRSPKGRNLDIDLESATVLYEDAKAELKTTIGKDIEGSMTTSDELDAIVAGEVAEFVRLLGPKTGDKKKPGEKSLGGYGKAISKGLFSVLNNKMYGEAKTVDLAREFRRQVVQYAQEVLGTKANIKGKSWDTVLSEALEKQTLNLESEAFGKVGAEDLWKQIAPTMEAMAKRITDPAVRARFENEIEKLKSATFKLGITKGKRKQILYGLIAKGKYGKTIKIKGVEKRVVDFDAMAAAGDLNDGLSEALDEYLKDKGYTKAQRDMVYDALIEDYEALKSAVAITRAFNINRKSKKAAELLKEVAMINGFFKQNNSQHVVDYKAKAEAGRDWLRAALRDLKTAIGNDLADKVTDDSDIEVALTHLVDQYVLKKDYKEIREAVSRLMVMNNRQYKPDVKKFDKLSRLMQMGIGFDNITDPIAAQVTGSRVSPEYIREMKEIVERYNAINDPKNVYAEAGIDPTLEPVNTTYSPAVFASLSMQQLNIDIANLISKHIRNNRWYSVPGVIEFMDKMQRSNLAARLNSLHNITQNLTTGLATVYSTGKGSHRKGMMKEYLQEFVAVLQGQPVSTDIDDLRRAKDASTVFHGKEAPMGVAFSRIKLYAEALLSGIDAGAGVVSVRNLMFARIYADLEIKFSHIKDPVKRAEEIEKIMAPYRLEENYKRAQKLAEANMKLVGNTVARRGQKAYNVMLHRETQNMELFLLMSGGLSKYVSPIRILTYYKEVNESVNERLGKRDASAPEKNDKGEWEEKEGNRMFLPNGVKRLINAIADGPQERAIRNYIENPNLKTRTLLFLSSVMKWLVHGGPFAYASGSYRFGDIGIIGAGLGFKQSFQIKGKTKKLEDILSVINADGYHNQEGYNEKDVFAASKEVEISRRKIQMATLALVGALAFLLIEWARSNDDDGDDFLEKAYNQLIDDATGNPGAKLLITRVLAPQIRILAAWGEAERRDKKFMDKVFAALGGVFNTRTPYTINDIVDSFRNRKTGEFDLAAFTRSLSGSLFGFMDTFTWPLGIANAIGDMNRGFKKDINFSNSPFISEESEYARNQLINGAAWGLGGIPPNYLLQNQLFDDLPGLKNDKPRPWKELKELLLGRSFKEIDWTIHNNKEWQDKKEGITIALKKTQDAYDDILKASIDLDMGRFRKKFWLDRSWRRPSLGFDVKLSEDPEVKRDELRKIARYIDVDMENRLIKEADKSGTFNILNVVITRWKSKGVSNSEQLTLDNIINAREYEILQNRLAGKVE